MPVLDINTNEDIDLRRFNQGAGCEAKKEKGRRYQLKELRDRQREIIRLSTLGYKGTVIATMLGCTPATVTHAINSQIAIDKRMELQEFRDDSVKDIMQSLQEMLPHALEVYNEVLVERKAVDPQRERLTKDLLDRTGFGKVQRIDSTVRHTHLTADDIASIKQKIAQRRQVEGEVIDDCQSGAVRSLRSFDSSDLFVRPRSGEDAAGNTDTEARQWPTPRVVEGARDLSGRLASTVG